MFDATHEKTINITIRFSTEPPSIEKVVKMVRERMTSAGHDDVMVSEIAEVTQLGPVDREKKRLDLIQASVTTLITLASAAVGAVYAAHFKVGLPGTTVELTSIIFYLATILSGIVILHYLQHIVAFRGRSVDDVRLMRLRTLQFWCFCLSTILLVGLVAGLAIYQ